MKQVILVITSAVFACLVGCGIPAYETPSAPPASQIQAEKFPRPSVAKAKKAVMNAIYRTYKDPDSARFRDFQVTDFGAVASTSGSWIWGYKAICTMNAKNGAGNYGGYKHYAYIVTRSGMATEIEGWRLHTRTYELVPYVHRTFHKF